MSICFGMKQPLSEDTAALNAHKRYIPAQLARDQSPCSTELMTLIWISLLQRIYLINHLDGSLLLLQIVILNVMLKPRNQKHRYIPLFECDIYHIYHAFIHKSFYKCIENVKSKQKNQTAALEWQLKSNQFKSKYQLLFNKYVEEGWVPEK